MSMTTSTKLHHFALRAGNDRSPERAHVLTDSCKPHPAATCRQRLPEMDFALKFRVERFALLWERVQVRGMGGGGYGMGGPPQGYGGPPPGPPMGMQGGYGGNAPQQQQQQQQQSPMDGVDPSQQHGACCAASYCVSWRGNEQERDGGSSSSGKVMPLVVKCGPCTHAKQ